MSEEVLHVLALKLTPGIGDVLAKQLISYCGSATAVYSERKGALSKIPNIGMKTIQALLVSDYLKTAEEILTRCHKIGVSVIPYYHKDYPQHLKVVNDSPLLIYYRGKNNFNNRKIISIVGTRKATEYGRQTTEKIIEDLAPYQTVVVSGLAYGIDISAHRSALKSGLPTLAVLAGGLDNIYPSPHKKTANEMLESGGWISEYPPGTKPETHNFPARNRIIAGMSEAVIVIEAANKGGALITANIAYSYNREVFAVPGTLEHEFSAGCNALIRAQRANIYTGVNDLKYLLGWEDEAGLPLKKQPDISQLSTPEQKIMRVLYQSQSGLQLDELSWQTQISVNETVSYLLNLEFEGFLKSLPGKKYKAV